ncbi:MAG TPA: ABC transporter permease [Blastocatellia bacterium]|nr:ABC transporter permease [Blastocatellia bacterium]
MMGWWQELKFIVRRLDRRRYERELDEEIRTHLELEAGRNVEAGMPIEEAHYAALRKFGSVGLAREDSRAMWGFRSLETLWQDLRYGFRMLGKNPGFTAIAVLTLALGIGANSAIFSVVNAVLLRPLPYKDPDRLVQFWETNPLRGWTQATVAPANFFDWEKQSQSFDGLAAYMGSDRKEAGLAGLQFTGGDEPERLQGLGVSANIFSVLGVEAALGRTFREEETWQGKHRVAVLSHGLWQRRFSASPDVIGRKITLNGRDLEIVGVMPPGFYFPSREVELWVPFGWNQNNIVQLRRPHFLRAVARLKPGVTVEQARAEMNNIAAALEEQYPDTNTQMGVGLGPLKQWIVEDTQLALIVFLVTVGLVLLIACANVANLQLARAAARTKEMAIRTALGARRGRIVRQLLTESLLLSIIGGALGLALAVWGRDLIIAFSPGNIPRLEETSLDARVLGFTVGITLLTVLLFGLAPAIHSSKPDPVIELKGGGRRGGVFHGQRLRSALVIGEVALSLMLVISAGLMIRSFMRLQQVDPGFDPDNALTLRISLPGAKYPEDKQATDFFERAQEKIRNLPGVLSVGATSRLALKGYRWTGDLTIEGRPPEEYDREVRHKEITPDYFRAMGISLIAGRFFDASDRAEGQPVVIINETLARRHFRNEDPVGKRLKFAKPEQDGQWRTIVGVVKDEKQDGLGAEVKPEIYETHLQSAQSEMTFVVRTATDPGSLTGAVREEIRSLDKDLPPYEVKTLNTVLHESVARERFTMILLATFAAVAMTLAAVGIYGVMSYTVVQRTHEMGIRMALGARPRDVLKVVVGQGMTLALIGVAVGLVAAFGVTRVMASLLFGVSSLDVATFAVTALLLVGVALLACYIPARRTAKIDPLRALRYE